VQVDLGGYWLADQALTSGYGQRERSPAVRFYRPDGTTEDLPVGGSLFWPNYLASQVGMVATGEDWGNTLWIGGYVDGRWKVKRPGNASTAFRSIMEVRARHFNSSRYNFMLAVAGKAGDDDDKFNAIGGMAFYEGKLLVCDRRNRRIKVYEARPAEEKWGALLKIIDFHKLDGGIRFMSPRDIAVAQDGTIYVLDGERREIAILSPTFERLGTIPGSQLNEPRNISLTPDGRELFLSDAATNLIHRYVRR
jgi:hypothetical protein